MKYYKTIHAIYFFLIISIEMERFDPLTTNLGHKPFCIFGWSRSKIDMLDFCSMVLGSRSRDIRHSTDHTSYLHIGALRGGGGCLASFQTIKYGLNILDPKVINYTNKIVTIVNNIIIEINTERQLYLNLSVLHSFG